MKTITKLEPRQPVVQKKKRVAAYARVSMDCERLQHSLSAQVSYYNDRIQKNCDWLFAGVYSDYGISGTGTAKRDGFNRMIEDAEQGRIDIILTKSISRFARNTVDLLETVRHLKELGVDVWFERENIHSLSGDGELMLSILASFAQEESRSTSENIKWRIRKNFEQGKLHNSRIYGYRIKNGNFEIVPEQAEVVQWIFREYMKGHSAYMLAKRLNEQGIPSYQGKEWSGSVVMQMMRNEKYTGNALLQKYYKASQLESQRIRNNGVLPMYYVENAIPAIIDGELFSRVQEEIALRYGTEICNVIAGSDAAQYHCHVENRVETNYPRRKAYWSSEQRARHAAIFNTRNTPLQKKYDLTLFMQCGVCGGNLTNQIRRYKDGTSESRWICEKHMKRLEEKNVDGARPVPLYDLAVKKIIADELGLPEFDKAVMEERLSHITVIGTQITLHYRDGYTATKEYTKHKKARCPRKEKSND